MFLLSGPQFSPLLRGITLHRTVIRMSDSADHPVRRWPGTPLTLSLVLGRRLQATKMDQDLQGKPVLARVPPPIPPQWEGGCDPGLLTRGRASNKNFNGGLGDTFERQVERDEFV